MKTIIYDTELNKFSRKFLVKNPGALEPSPLEFIVQSKIIDAALFEQFLLFDTTTFKVYGENIPLALLINHFGVSGVEALIDQDALQFILWNQVVTFIVDDIAGLDPLQSGSINSPAHSDPDESIKLGFNFMLNPPRTSDRKNLIRKLRDRYSLPDQSLSGNAVLLSKSAYESGKLKPYGLSPDICSFKDINKDARKKLCHCAEEILQYSHLINNNMTSYSSFEFYQLFNESNRKIHHAAKIESNFNALSKLENIPDLKSLHPHIKEPFKQIVKLRNRNSSKKFREWLATCSAGNDATEISKEYVDAIANATGFFQTTTGKITKNIAMSAVGAGIGALIAGPAGVVGGASLTKYLEPVVDAGLDLLDELVLTGLTKGWTPKMFFDDLSKLEKANSTQHSNGENSNGS